MILSDKRLLSYPQRLRRLRFLAVGFLLFLLIPIAALLYFGFQQLQTNLLTEYQRESDNLATKFNGTLYKKITFTNTLSVNEFDYYQQVFNPVTNQQQQVLSPLSSLNHLQPNEEQPILGLVGYFQIDSHGLFNSPVWPEKLSEKDLVDNQLATSEESNQGVFSGSTLHSQELAERKAIALNIYQIVSQSKTLNQVLQQDRAEKNHFFSVIFDIPEYFVFYRVVTVSEQRKLQGYLVKRRPYMRQLLTEILEWRSFKSPVLVKLDDVKHGGQTELFLHETHADNRTKVSQPIELDNRFEQQMLYQTNLQWPYLGYSLTLSTNALPITPTMVYSAAFIFIVIITILLACFGFYRIGVKHLLLAEQRLNFVSSVSHELKTPLTSISMYSQMLKDGMVLSEAHQKDYYDFIYEESERLTRLINNILQLSALSHNQQTIKPQYVQLSVLQDIIRSKTSSIIDKHKFQQNIIIDIDVPESILVLVDPDAFSQVVINITDNAVKFFDQEKINDSGRQKIDYIFCQPVNNDQVIQLEIRDYGEGITKEQENKIFELFYRGGNELTRSTQGTGIGLALVNELVHAQHGEIKVERNEPGLSIKISFHIKK